MSSIHFLYPQESSSRATTRETPRGLVIYFALTLRRWVNRIKQRTDLAELDDHLLKDIGKTRAEVETESSKPFWMA